MAFVIKKMGKEMVSIQGIFPTLDQAKEYAKQNSLNTIWCKGKYFYV